MKKINLFFPILIVILLGGVLGTLYNESTFGESFINSPSTYESGSYVLEDGNMSGYREHSSGTITQGGFSLVTGSSFPNGVNQFYNASITLQGKAYRNFTSANSTHNFTYLSNSTYGNEMNITFNNSNNWTSIYNITINIQRSGITTYDIYLFNFTSNSFGNKVDSCIDFCAFGNYTTASPIAWQNDWKNSSGGIIMKLDNSTTGGNLSKIIGSYIEAVHANPDLSYAQNITLRWTDNPNINYSITNASNFTENNITDINLTAGLLSIYPNGTTANLIGLDIVGDGDGLVYVSDFNISYDATLVTGGGSGGSPITLDDVTFANEDGGGKVIIEPNTTSSWSMSFVRQEKRYEAEMQSGSSRKFNMEFENLGDSERNIKLSCISNSTEVCDYIKFEEDDFVLKQEDGLKQVASFDIILPEDIGNGDYEFDVIATDDLGRKAGLKIFLGVGFLGLFTAFFTKLFTSNGLGIPYFLIFSAVVVMSFLILSRILTNIPLKALWVILITLSMGFLSVYLM